MFLLFQLLVVHPFHGGGVRVAALIKKTKQTKKQKLNNQKKLTLKLEDQAKKEEFLIEYFAGLKKGDFYEEPVQGEYPDW